MTYNVFSGTLNPAHSLAVEKFQEMLCTLIKLEASIISETFSITSPLISTDTQPILAGIDAQPSTGMIVPLAA